MEKNTAPTRSMTMLAPETPRIRKRRSGMSGSLPRTWSTRNTASSTADAASQPRVWADPHGYWSVPTMA